MKTPDKGIGHKETINGVKLEEVDRGGKKHPIQVRLMWIDPDKPSDDKRSYLHRYNWRDARKKAAEIGKKLEDGKYLSDTATITFAKGWEVWIKRQEDLYASKSIWGNTLKNYQWGGNHLVPYFGRKKVTAIKAHDVEAFVAYLRKPKAEGGAGLAYHSAHNIYGYLSKFLSFCKRRGWHKENVLLTDPVKVPGKRQKRQNTPKVADIELLIQILHGPRPLWMHAVKWSNRKIAFALGAFAGLRGGEVAALRWDRIDLANTRLEIDKKEGSNSAFDGLKPPKSEAGARKIPICRYLYDALMDHVAVTGQEGFVWKRKHGGLTPSRDENHPKGGMKRKLLPAEGPISAQEVSDSHRDLMRLAALVEEDGTTIRFPRHCLRHFYASACMKLGVNVLTGAKRMGHSDPSITLNWYAYDLDDVDKLEEELPPIWHERLARAEPRTEPRMIDGISDGVLIEGTSVVLEEVAVDDPRVPDKAPKWVPYAVRLLEGGWKPAAIAKHLGQHRTTLNKTFHRLGLPAPDTYRRAARDRIYQELYDQGFSDGEIATRTNTNRVTVTNWRTTHECDRPNTRKSLITLQKERAAEGQKATKMRQKQLDLL